MVDREGFPLVIMPEASVPFIPIVHCSTSKDGVHGTTLYKGQTPTGQRVFIEVPWVVDEASVVSAVVLDINHNLCVTDAAGHVVGPIAAIAACFKLVSHATPPWFEHALASLKTAGLEQSEL